MVPHMKVDVRTLGADFVAFSGHKMLGPTGTGVLWGKREILSKMRPFLFGGDMIGEVKITGATWADIPSRFEAGTPDIAGIIGLGAAVDYLDELGMDNVRQHEKELMVYALEKMMTLQDEELVTVYGPKDVEERGGALAFNVTGVHPHDAAQVLDSFRCGRSGQRVQLLVTGFGVPAMVRPPSISTMQKRNYLVDKIREVPKVLPNVRLQDIIIDHYKNPELWADGKTDISMDEVNASCGDMMRIQVKTQKPCQKLRK
jgi:cysteine desulfurase/selenocysteine lyase